jgi:branched-chain amino acid transport system substrate-binding protein
MTHVIAASPHPGGQPLSIRSKRSCSRWVRGTLLAALAALTALGLPIPQASAAVADGAPVFIGLDAEFGSKTSTSGQAVRQGMEIAIDEINRAGGVLKGRRLELVTRDNRSIPAMGVDDLKELAAIPDLVGVFGAKYSPVLVEWLTPAHELGIPIFATWSSADPITDHAYRPSFSFRLSLKDEWAGPAFLRFAAQHYGARKVGLLLPNSAWGRSNKAAITRAAGTSGVSLAGERWYNWGDKSLLEAYRELARSGAQAIILVANEVEGSILVKEVAALPKAERLPIICHWGVTGGRFAEMAGDALDQVDFSVIQTFSFIGARTTAAPRVLKALKARYGLEDPARIPSPVGIAHAYDLTHLLARAIDKAGSTDRAKIRAALEHLGPYAGLVRNYPRPFTATRHDALGPEQIFMARYTADDRLVPIAWKPR